MPILSPTEKRQRLSAKLRKLADAIDGLPEFVDARSASTLTGLSVSLEWDSFQRLFARATQSYNGAWIHQTAQAGGIEWQACRRVADEESEVELPGPRIGNVNEAIEELRAAGLDAWDSKVSFTGDVDRLRGIIAGDGGDDELALAPAAHAACEEGRDRE